MPPEDTRRKMFDVGVRVGMEKAAVSSVWVEEKMWNALNSENPPSKERLRNMAYRMLERAQKSAPHAAGDDSRYYDKKSGNTYTRDFGYKPKKLTKKQIDTAFKRWEANKVGGNLFLDASMGSFDYPLYEASAKSERMRFDKNTQDKLRRFYPHQFQEPRPAPKTITPKPNAPAIAVVGKKRSLKNPLIAAGALAALMAGGGYAYKKNKQR